MLILTDDRFGGSVLGGSLPTLDALDEVLFNDPPLANFLITYPRHPLLVDDVWLPADQSVLVSMAACNNDPAIRVDDHLGNRSHLAWGIGQHACPAQSLSYVIAQSAIDQLLDALPEMEPALPGGTPTWRPGPLPSRPGRAAGHIHPDGPAESLIGPVAGIEREVRGCGPRQDCPGSGAKRSTVLPSGSCTTA